MQFFVLRVASNKEDRVRESLARKVKIENLEDNVGRILVPTERVRSMKGGQRKDTERKLYPGYVFIELNLDKNGMMDYEFMGHPQARTPRQGAPRALASLRSRP